MGRTPYLIGWGSSLLRMKHSSKRSCARQIRLIMPAGRWVNSQAGNNNGYYWACAGAANPYLLLDEPTTHLDLQFQIGLMERIHQLAHPGTSALPTRAVLIAVHDLNLALEFADRVALLVKGEILHLGTPADVLQPELLSQVYDVPLTLLRDPNNGQTALLPKIGHQ